MEVSRCCCRQVRVEDIVRDSAMLKLFLFSCFGVASRILGSALAPSKDAHRGRVYSHVGGCEVAGLVFSVSLWFSAVCPLGMCADVRQHALLRSSHNG